MMYELRKTKQFDRWIKGIKDIKTKMRVLSRLDDMSVGHFGDFRKIDDDLSELRFFFAGGLRVYFKVQNEQIIVLLVGGDKDTQKRDIEKAREVLKDLEVDDDQED